MQENSSPSPNEISPNTHKLTLRCTLPSDFEAVSTIMKKVYSNSGGAWTWEEFISQLEKFPEGQFCIEDNGTLLACEFSMIVNSNQLGEKHTYNEITSNGFLHKHNPLGDTLYGVDMVVDPEYQGHRLGRRLYDARKELARKLNLKKIIVGARIPGYSKFAEEMSPQAYVESVRSKGLYDPVLTFQLANELHVTRVMKDYFRLDPDSKNYAILLEWINIYYEEKTLQSQKSIIRLGVVQWQMRSAQSLQDFQTQIEFFVDAVAGYKADFVLFPEFFNVPLMAQYNKLNPSDAMRALAGYTDQLIDFMSELAVSYNINIISGSMPYLQSGILKNVSYLLRRDGTREKQFKIHVTPSEETYWGIKGGDKIQVFDTDVCKIGILICFDVEFPELPRILAEKGMQILFVPFSTDTKNSYNRVRLCAQARAVENECYVAISGSVGNLPNVENMDIQYAQSAVFTPSDFPFSQDAIASEATPNTEMTLIVDVDLDLLKQLNLSGSVRNLATRRHDLYKIQWVGETN